MPISLVNWMKALDYKEPTYEPYVIFNDKTLYISSNYTKSLDMRNITMKSIDTIIFQENINENDHSRFDKPLILTPHVRHLTMGYSFNHHLILPKNILFVQLGDRFNQPIILTPRITVLTFGYGFNQPIILPIKIKRLTFGRCFNKSIILTPYITSLTFGDHFNQPIILTHNIVCLMFGTFFNQPIILTPKLNILTLGYNFSRSIILTPNITVLNLGFKSNLPVIFQESIAHLAIDADNHQLVDNLPNSTKYLIFGYHFTICLDNLPSKAEKINIANQNYKYTLPVNAK